jgi:hypothetical protein
MVTKTVEKNAIPPRQVVLAEIFVGRLPRLAVYAMDMMRPPVADEIEILRAHLNGPQHESRTPLFGSAQYSLSLAGYLRRYPGEGRWRYELTEAGREWAERVDA